MSVPGRMTGVGVEREGDKCEHEDSGSDGYVVFIRGRASRLALFLALSSACLAGFPELPTHYNPHIHSTMCSSTSITLFEHSLASLAVAPLSISKNIFSWGDPELL